jgi:ADP-ribose pyrophosphatase YjhB (NUDIX family)
MHNIQKEIILDLIHKPKAAFTELLKGRRNSNDFSYHLNALKENKLIILKEGFYSLSSEGKKLSAFIEGATGERAEFPTFSHVIIAWKGRKLLAQRRLKEPFYGVWGLISGKINFGLNIEECALRDITEESGLYAKAAKLIAVNQIKTNEEGKLAFHHIMFHVRLDGITGKLLEKTYKAENKWVTVEEFKQLNRFPDPWLDYVIEAKKFLIVETEREIKDGIFISGKITKKRLV